MTEKERLLREQRAGVVHEMRAMLDTAEDEKRELTSDETIAYEGMETRIASLEKGIEREERLAGLEGDLSDTRDDKNLNSDLDSRKTPLSHADEIRSYVDKFHSTERADLTEDQFNAMQSDIFCRWALDGMGAINGDELRALQMDSDVLGGYVTTPQVFVNKLIKAMRDKTVVRRLANVQSQPKAASIGRPSLDNRPADPTWTKEIGTGSEDSTMSFGKREIWPHPLAQRIKISQKLLRASFMNIEALVRDEMAYKFRTVQENAFINGTGAEQPLGFMVASNDGISTGRDVSTDNTATLITTDGLIEAKHTLKSGYWDNATWIFHRDAIKQIRKLKDGQGQYIWQPGIIKDSPSVILEIPYEMSEFMPNTFTASQYVGIIGDFENYWIVDSLQLTFQRLVELYAEANQIGFIGRMETDGLPVLEEAFVRVKLAAS